MATSRAAPRVRFSDRVETFEDSRRRRTSRVAATTGLTPGAEVYTCLPLQMAVYFNVFYAPLWATGYVLALQTKFSQLPTHYRYVSVLVMVVMTLIEVVRLYLAYVGNLKEKVAELAGFWLLTLLQTPLTLYTLANTHTLPGPLEVALSLPLLLFLFSQLALGLWTLHRLVNSQALKFHLSQNSNLRHTPSSPSTSTTNGNVRTEGGREHIEMTKLG